MAKPIKKLLSPGESIASLQAFNEAVLMLINTVGMALNHNLVDSKVSGVMQENLDRVKAFYVYDED